MNKYERFFKKAKEHMEHKKFIDAHHSLKLIKDKSPLMKLYDIVCLRSITSKSIQCYHKYKDFMELDCPEYLKIISQQIIFDLSEDIKERPTEEIIKLKEIINEGDKIKNNLENDILKYETEIRSFLNENPEIFELIFHNSILFKLSEEEIQNEVIIKIKNKKSPDVDVTSKAINSKYINDIMLDYIERDYDTVIKKYESIKEDKRYLYRTIYAEALFEKKRYDKVIWVLTEVMEKDEDKNPLACELYVKSCYNTKNNDKIIQFKNRYSDIEDCKSCLIFAEIIDLKENHYIPKALKKAREYIDENEDFEINVLYIEILLEDDKDFYKADDELYNLAIKNLHSKHLNELTKLSYKFLDDANEFENKHTNKKDIEIYKRKIFSYNAILLLDPKNKKITEEIAKIIRKWQCQELKPTEQLSINDIVTEVRITKDLRYLKYKAEKFFESKDWEKSLYFIEVVLVFEPTNEKFLKLKNDALNSTKKYNPLSQDVETKFPKETIIFVDANIIIDKILSPVDTDTGVYKIPRDIDLDAEKLFGRISNNNKIHITESILEEVEKVVYDERIEDAIAENCSKSKFGEEGYIQIMEKIKERTENIKQKYLMKNKIHTEKSLESVRKFYHDRLCPLENITSAKLAHLDENNKIRKLVQREGYLPEKNDMKLLAEAISIKKKTGREVGIFTRDADFTYFCGDIKVHFGIKIFDVSILSKTINNPPGRGF